MRSISDGHRSPPRIVTKLLLVLGLAAGTLLATAGTASAKCVDAYVDQYGTTVCTP